MKGQVIRKVHTYGMVYFSFQPDWEDIVGGFEQFAECEADEWCREKRAVRGPVRVIRHRGDPADPYNNFESIGFKFKCVLRPPKAILPLLDEVLAWGNHRTTHIDTPGGPRQRPPGNVRLERVGP